MKPFTYFSTFSGIGGFEVGIERAAFSVWNGATQDTKPTTYEQGMEPASAGLFSDGHSSDPKFRGNSRQVSCVGFSEIDKYASSVYQYHFPGVKNYGDITKINEKELPDFDCLVGGFPCQAFSIAGKRGGFADTRGTLFFDLARILKEKQPRLFVFENVKGLLSHDEGRTIRTIIATIDELGYDCQWQVLNSKNHGVPQNRERIYIVGHLRGTTRPEVFPFTGANPRSIKQLGNIDQHKRQRENPQTGRVYSPAGVSPALSTMQGGGLEPKILSYDYKNPTSETRRGRVKEGYVGTLETNPLVGVVEGAIIRRLTPKECERLQGFPDNWTQYGRHVVSTGVHDVLISDTQRYKMCGNAVTTNVVQAVFERIFNGTA